MAYKRKRVYAPRSTKRRRTGKGRRFARKRRAGAKKAASWTIQTGTGKGLFPSSRKLTRRAWKNHLWRDTLANTHWSSMANTTTAINTGTTVALGTTSIIFPTFGGTPGPTTAFWTATGGLQPKDEGAAVPTFEEGNIVIRGGQIGFTVSVPDDQTEECTLRIWTVFLTPEPDLTLVPTTIPYGAQLKSHADFEARVGRVVDYKEATLGHGTNPVFTYVRRLGVQKIDMETWGTTLGKQHIFIVALANMQDATNVILPSITWHDMSFCGDVNA